MDNPKTSLADGRIKAERAQKMGITGLLQEIFLLGFFVRSRDRLHFLKGEGRHL